jgi:transposase
MWAFRRDPDSLSAEEGQALEALFEKIPALRPLYEVRLRFKEIFDLARERITAARWLRELRRQCDRLGLDLRSFFETYDRWKTEILNYFDARQTSAAVEPFVPPSAAPSRPVNFGLDNLALIAACVYVGVW